MAAPLYDLRIEEQDLSSADLTLEADTGESLEIWAMGLASGADETVAEVSVGEVMMLAFQSDDGDDEMFPEPLVHNKHMDVLGMLREQGYNLPTLKVPEGDTFVLTDPDGNANATVLYREAGAGEYRPGSDGGPEGRIRPFISSGQVTDSIGSQSTETHTIDTSVNPAQLDDWPYEEDVRNDREYDLVAMAVDMDNSAGGNTTLDGVRLISEEVDFLARDNAFIDEANMQYPSDWGDTMLMAFPEPITFAPGDDFQIQYQASNTNTMSAENAIVNAAIVATRRDVGV